MSTVIKVEGLSKQYRLGHVGRKTLHGDFNRWLYRVTGREDPYLKIGEENDRAVKGSSDYVWALKDINFDVQQGEVLGIIGRNGAGKSTLLKILSKVTTPTTGNVKIKGRIASLLEVGTGFHPELSGRDNIFLNGAIMGMSRKEIQKKLDEIVDFAGVERYIDTPVKRYSSGMYVRLAFAVAAYLEPDILIIDEVLAVGDAEFQKKCLGKMKDVSERDGRTVLFVSHNLSAVSNLCMTGIVLNNGRIIVYSKALDAVKEYNRLNLKQDKHLYEGESIIKKASLFLDEEVGSLKIIVDFQSPHPIKRVVLGIVIKDGLDTPLIGVNNKHYKSESLNQVEIGTGRVFAEFNNLRLMPGDYKIDIFLGDSTTDIDKVENGLSFNIKNLPAQKTSTPIDLRLNKLFIESVVWGIVTD